MFARAAQRLLVLLAASGAAASVDTSTPLPADWIEVAADTTFSVMAPPGTTFQRSAGVDSFTGVFNAPGFAVHVDFGAHSNPLDPDRGKTQYVARAIRVDGKPARLVTARTRTNARSYFIGLHIPAVGRSVTGTIGLTLTCDLEREREYAIVESVYRSARFK